MSNSDVRTMEEKACKSRPFSIMILLGGFKYGVGFEYGGRNGI